MAKQRSAFGFPERLHNRQMEQAGNSMHVPTMGMAVLYWLSRVPEARVADEPCVANASLLNAARAAARRLKRNASEM
eukprot:11809376-Alexandrium_andersonii.AAC.1